MKNVFARLVWIYSIYGNVGFSIDTNLYPNLVSELANDYPWSKRTGFSFTIGELKNCNTGEYVEKDLLKEYCNKVIPASLPFGITKEDVLKMIELEKMDKIASYIKSDSYVNIKDISIKLGEDIVKELVNKRCGN